MTGTKGTAPKCTVENPTELCTGKTAQGYSSSQVKVVVLDTQKAIPGRQNERRSVFFPLFGHRPVSRETLSYTKRCV